MTGSATPIPERQAPLWDAATVAGATGGKAQGDWQAFGVSIDSRSLNEGDLFVALKGPNFDGHDFAAQTLKQGAAAVMIDHKVKGLKQTDPHVMVKDTMTGLNQLARAGRERTGARIIAVTGSVGKTSVKEALRAALGRQGPTLATEGNLNNEIGTPLSLARMPEDITFGVIELGMNHPGELERLSMLSRPHVVLITAVEAVHLEFFDSVEAIAAAKAEIISGLEPGGIAVLPRDNPHFAILEAAARNKGARIISFGADPKAGVHLISAESDAEGSDIIAEVLGRRMSFRINLAGRHWIHNALAVLAGVAALEGDVEEAATALSQLSAVKGRGARQEILIEGGTATLIDDSYNASPASVRAALSVLSASEDGRKIAVLGDMLELGQDELELHAGLRKDILLYGVNLVFTAGRRMKALYDALPDTVQGAHADNSEALVGPVQDALLPGDTVLVKGSAGSRMGVIVEALSGENKNKTRGGA